MMVKDILRGCGGIREIGAGHAPSILERDVAGIAYDSRLVRDNYLFVAIRGEKCDGHSFVRDAVQRGASVIVAERENLADRSGYILVENSRRALACIAHNFYERPSGGLVLCGVTGTNGKTTTTYILKSILEAWGRQVGLIGTIRYLVGETSYPAFHTTPEAVEFQSLLRGMLSAGCTHVVAEISSHALAQYRVDNSIFRTAVFTNLTRDHLDFHKTMEDYFRAKERLFVDLLDGSGTAVINSDDPYGKRLASRLRRDFSDRRILTYGFDGEAHIVAYSERVTGQGLRFTLSFGDARYEISSPLLGLPNIYNIMSAAAAAESMGVPRDRIVLGIEKAGTVPGRFEKVEAGQGFLCVLDYAHTEDALERAIMTARTLISASGSPARGETLPDAPRVITVFGCGGDRDRGKRPRMGAISTRLSDVVIVTSDNPRSEDPAAIIADILAGVVKDNYLVEPDRRKAIQRAIQSAREGDVVLVAGKGHEDYQEIGGVRYPFSDRDVLREALITRRGATSFG